MMKVGKLCQVRLEGDLGDKLFRAQNLILASNSASNGIQPRRVPEAAAGEICQRV